MKLGIICFIIGVLAGFTSTYYFKTNEIKTLEEQVATLKTQISSERTKTVEIEKPDGTKIKTVEVVKEVKVENSKISETKVKTEPLKENEIGVRGSYNFKSFDSEIYIRAGTKCVFVSCYVEGSYGMNNGDVKATIGVSYKF